MKELANELLERVRKVANDHADDAFANGFDEAANICVGLLSETTEGKHSDPHATCGLSVVLVGEGCRFAY